MIAVAACHASQLAISVGGAEGAAGTIYYTIRFRNRSGTTCSLRGYPGVSSVGGADGHQIGAPARRQDVTPVKTIVLPKGASARANYGQAQALNFPKARCKPVSARGLRVYAPNVTAARYLPLRHLACSTTVIDSTIAPVT